MIDTSLGPSRFSPLKRIAWVRRPTFSSAWAWNSSSALGTVGGGPRMKCRCRCGRARVRETLCSSPSSRCGPPCRRLSHVCLSVKRRLQVLLRPCQAGGRSLDLTPSPMRLETAWSYLVIRWSRLLPTKVATEVGPPLPGSLLTLMSGSPGSSAGGLRWNFVMPRITPPLIATICVTRSVRCAAWCTVGRTSLGAPLR